MSPSRMLRRLLLVLPCLLLAVAAPAAEKLNEATVPVAGQSAPERARAVIDGLRQVLVKTSGDRAVLGNPLVQQELPRAQALLNAWRYEAAPPVDAAATDTDPQLAPLRLHLTFDAPSVEALLNRAGAPVWSPNRPAVLFHVVTGEPPLLVTPGVALADSLLDAAAQRALPVVLPGVGADPAVPLVAARALVVQARLVAGSGRHVAAGTLLLDGEPQPLEVGGEDAAAALRELVATVADRVGARHAVVARSDRNVAVRLRITGIRTLQAHAGVERWLQSSPLVRGLGVAVVAGTHVDFLVTLAGDAAQLRAALAADSRFIEVGQPQVEGPVLRLEARLRPDPG